MEKNKRKTLGYYVSCMDAVGRTFFGVEDFSQTVGLDQRFPIEPYTVLDVNRRVNERTKFHAQNSRGSGVYEFVDHFNDPEVSAEEAERLFESRASPFDKSQVILRV